jgi:hypothetical protein
MGRDSMYFLMAAGGMTLTILFAVALLSQPPAVSGSRLALQGGPVIYPNRFITPGETNPAITQATIGQTICSKHWSTKSVRDTQSTPAQKAGQYAAYHIVKPKQNSGQNQTCELDHLVSLELGGSDSLANIWPECGPAGVPLNQRYFKEKDTVENYLHAQVCSGALSLSMAQNEIVGDWYAVYRTITTDRSRLGGMVSFDSSDPDDN